MVVNTLNCIESITNPGGRFKTLHGIYPRTMADGEPEMQVRGGAPTFRVVWSGCEYWLQCFLAEGTTAANNARLISSRTVVPSQYLTKYLYLDGEMTVFDDHGGVHSCDVVLQQIPTGRKLCHFMEQCCAADDTASVKRLLEQWAAMAVWLYDNSFMHNSIKPANIIVTPEFTPVLINYDAACTSRTDGDNDMLGIIGLVLFVLACAPNAYGMFGRESLFSIYNIRCLAAQVASLPQCRGCAPLRELVNMVAGGRELTRRQVNTIIGELASSTDGDMKRAIVAIYSPGEHRPESDFSKYDFVAPMSDNVMLAGYDNQMVYINRDGQIAIDKRFNLGYSFEEGRAVVQTESGYGLIDHDGNFILEPRFKDMTWNGQSGIAIAVADGLCGMFNRSGEPITPMIYDHIDECSEGLIAASDASGMFGYLRRDGSVAIDFIYEEADSFADGIAWVQRGGQRFEIDTNGKRIN